MSEPQTQPDNAPRQVDTHSITSAAGLIGAATFSSRILGFIRDVVLAQLFGASAAADAFYVAYRIPNLLRELFAEGSMSSAFIPVFTEYHTLRSKHETWELASAAFTTLLTIVTVVTIIGIIAAPSLVWLLAPGFHEEAAQLARATLLTQVMFPYLLFVSLAALAMGILNSLKAFAVPALAPVFFNIVVIAFALFVTPFFEQPILAVGIGIVAGGLAQFAMQLPAIQRRGLLPSWRFQPGHPGVKQMGRLILPTLLGLSVTQVNLTVSTILSSYFEGGPTYLFYGMRLIQFPLGIFGVALATAILPTLSRQAASGAIDDLRDTVNFGIRMILFIILPAMLGLILLGEPIIHIFFEHGAFTSEDTTGTANALMAFSIGLWSFASYRILATAFYSLQDTKTPAMAAVAGMCANMALALILMQTLEYVGLALATACASMVNATILIIILNRRIGGLHWPRLAQSIGRTIVALIPLSLICMWVAQNDLWRHPDMFTSKVGVLTLGIMASVAAYFGVHRLLHSKELDDILSILRKKLRRG
ncbi:MAG: murein biosynthesis integral membrane protein MurJ [Nitrospirales bacterium]|nr:murein biosynthesis integral membrane protein MurJ [Nitrospira sp.]MDR4501234.1 murein biosynthesis integral membrane protein MurJ [Nitrospirales bacterium]